MCLLLDEDLEKHGLDSYRGPATTSDVPCFMQTRPPCVQLRLAPRVRLLLSAGRDLREPATLPKHSATLMAYRLPKASGSTACEVMLLSNEAQGATRKPVERHKEDTKSKQTHQIHGQSPIIHDGLSCMTRTVHGWFSYSIIRRVMTPATPPSPKSDSPTFLCTRRRGVQVALKRSGVDARPLL